MLRVLFHTNVNDPRPVNWPIPHPYWITGTSILSTYATVVAYADDEQYIFTHWPDACDLDIQEVDGYSFSSRFPKPDWVK